MKTPTIEFARSYLAAGLTPIPINPDGTKRPAVSWKQYQSAPPNADELPGLFPNGQGVAIVHGAVSGGSEVVDIDTADLLNPFVESLDHAAPGLYRRLCVVETPRPGYHIAYRCEAAEGNQKLAMRPPTAEERAANPKAGPAVLIETRGEGGYTLAPGTPGACHPTGREYKHLEGPPLTEIPTITPAEREAIFRAARSLDRMPAAEPDIEVDPRTYGGESPGDAFARGTDWPSILEPHGWVRVGDSGDRQLWRRPGKADGWSATTGCVSKAGNDLLSVFSTNAWPFEGPSGSASCSTHGKFDAYARLNHEGDHSAAAKELLRLGYGDRPRVEYADPALRDTSPSAPLAPRKPVAKFSLRELRSKYSKMAEPVIDGLLRAGETCNIIAAPKAGKSWLGYGLALSIAGNQRWLGRFGVNGGRVLLVDNELHKETLASRIPAVAEAMGLPMDMVERDLDVWPLRGDLRSLQELGAEFDQIEPGEYRVVILDALYRFAEQGVSENDNAAMTQVYNLIDRFAARTQAAFILIHHASKGSQAGKAVTDVGAGAGAQSRATDCHLVLREHEEPDCAVLDAAVRSFAPVEPVTLRWAFPVWIADERLDPSRLAARLGQGQQARVEQDRADKQRIAEALASTGDPLSTRKVREATGFSKDKAERLLIAMVAEGEIEACEGTIGHNVCTLYSPPTTGGGRGGTRVVRPPSAKRTGGGGGAVPKGVPPTPPTDPGTPGVPPSAGFPEFAQYAEGVA